METTSAMDLTGRIGILGTGEFARALATRFHNSGIDVTIGSRYPDKRKAVPHGDIMTKVKVASTEQCLKVCDIIFVAIHPQHHSSLSNFEDFLREKVLIDVSNSMVSGDESNAEILARLLPSSHVVKGFNLISAYAISSEFESNPHVHICGNDFGSKSVVMQVAARLGFFPIDCGSLKRANHLEKRNRQLFAGWGGATIVVGFLTVMWTVLALLRYFDWRNPPYTWERLPTNVVNKIVACVSITSLCFVYLPGCFAGFTQLCWGTKHRRFNKFLDGWLKMRKQLGLYALLFGVLHMIMSSVLLSPAYYSKWYIKTSEVIPGNNTENLKIGVSSRMNIVGETCVLLGVLAITSMGVLGMTSIPSIAKAMNWREWRCIQSYLGFACLLLATAHLTVKGATSWVNAESYKDFLPTVTFFSLPIPWFTVLMKILVFLPCCHFKLNKIRGGWERNDHDDVKPKPVHTTKTISGSENMTAFELAAQGQSNPAFVV